MWLPIVLLATYLGLSSANLPVVLWHGMGDSCCNPLTMGGFSRMIKKNLPGTHVHSIKIKDGITSDTIAGFIGSVNEQVDIACDQIAKNSALQNGYNAVGLSQGAQFLRAVAQRCPNPPMHNLISLGGQHQGVYGIPQCNYEQDEVNRICEGARSAVTWGAYLGPIQSRVVQAQYWHDPTAEWRYRRSNIFLADLNQENKVNQTYKDNLMKLNAFVMVKFNQDSMVIPKESQWFGYYVPGQTEVTQTLQESSIYKRDKLGLREMDKQGKLHFIEKEGDHLQFSNQWSVDNILEVYLK